MDGSTESDEQQCLRSPPRRRRSTFFIRRESLVPQQPPENLDPVITEPREDKDSKHTYDMESYCEKLTSEKEQWKKEVTNRKHKYHDLRQQYQLMANAPSRTRISYASLSNEDIEFLKGKINISKFIECQSNFHKSVAFTREVYKRAVQLDDTLVQHVEEKIKKITEHILEHSTIEPVDVKSSESSSSNGEEN